MRVDVATLVAGSICWLSRQPGLPAVHGLRVAVATRHPVSCAYCDWPVEELAKLYSDDQDIKAFEKLPAVTQRRLVDRAAEAIAA